MKSVPILAAFALLALAIQSDPGAAEGGRTLSDYNIQKESDYTPVVIPTKRTVNGPAKRYFNGVTSRFSAGYAPRHAIHPRRR